MQRTCFVTMVIIWPTFRNRNKMEHLCASFNPLECRDNYSATSNNIKLVHWPLMGGLLHLIQRGRGLGGVAACPTSGDSNLLSYIVVGKTVTTCQISSTPA